MIENIHLIPRDDKSRNHADTELSVDWNDDQVDIGNIRLSTETANRYIICAKVYNRLASISESWSAPHRLEHVRITNQRLISDVDSKNFKMLSEIDQIDNRFMSNVIVNICELFVYLSKWYYVHGLKDVDTLMFNERGQVMMYYFGDSLMIDGGYIYTSNNKLGTVTQINAELAGMSNIIGLVRSIIDSDIRCESVVSSNKLLKHTIKNLIDRNVILDFKQLKRKVIDRLA